MTSIVSQTRSQLCAKGRAYRVEDRQVLEPAAEVVRGPSAERAHLCEQLCAARLCVEGSSEEASRARVECHAEQAVVARHVHHQCAFAVAVATPVATAVGQMIVEDRAVGLH